MALNESPCVWQEPIIDPAQREEGKDLFVCCTFKYAGKRYAKAVPLPESASAVLIQTIKDLLMTAANTQYTLLKYGGQRAED